MDFKSATTKPHTTSDTSSKMTSPMTMDFVSCSADYNPSTKAVMDRFADVMDRECDMHHFIHEQIAEMKQQSKTIRNGCGWFVLYDDKKNLLCVAFLFQCRINNIWSPKRFRKMGYATELFRRIGEFYKDKKMPIWCPAYKYIHKTLENAGWKFPTECVADTDPKSEYIYAPDWCFNHVSYIHCDGDERVLALKTMDLNKKYEPIANLGRNFRILADLKFRL